MSPLTENSIYWYPICSISKIQVQSEHSHLEQNMGLKICMESIDTHCNIMTQTTLTK